MPDQVVVTGTASGLGEEMARLLLGAGARVYGVDLAEAAADLTEAETFTDVRGSVTDVATWQDVVAALNADAPDGVGSLGFVPSSPSAVSAHSSGNSSSLRTPRPRRR